MNSPHEKGICLSKPPNNQIVESNVSSETIPEPHQPNFEFVEGIGNPTTRSHAMKSYWRRKKNERRQEDTKLKQPALRPLVSSEQRGEDELAHSTQSQPTNETSSYYQNSSIPIQNAQALGIPDQLFAGLRFAFDSALGQRVETSSCQILAHHHQFFYHCECIRYISQHSNVEN